MKWSRVVSGKRWPVGLCLIGWMLSSACGSGSGNAGPDSTDTDTDDTDTPSDSPGNLPNLSTHSNEHPAQEQPPEPADCAVLTLTSCVTDALEELSSCLAAGHGGAFAADSSRCELTEANAVVTFSQAVSRWSTPSTLSFVLDVAGTTCASYAERSQGSGMPTGIEVVTAQHAVSLETDADLQSTLTCNGVSVAFKQANLSGCREAKAAPTPELMDQTLDGLYSVTPRQQSNRRIFNCQFPPSTR